jgi:hypothetical protein
LLSGPREIALDGGLAPFIGPLKIRPNESGRIRGQRAPHHVALSKRQHLCELRLLVRLNPRLTLRDIAELAQHRGVLEEIRIADLLGLDDADIEPASCRVQSDLA